MKLFLHVIYNKESFEKQGSNIAPLTFITNVTSLWNNVFNLSHFRNKLAKVKIKIKRTG